MITRMNRRDRPAWKRLPFPGLRTGFLALTITMLVGVARRNEGLTPSVALYHHSCGIRAIAPSPRGGQVAWLGWDGIVGRSSWRPTGAGTRSLEREFDADPSSLTFSPDGAYLILGLEDGTVEVFDNDSDQLRFRLDSGGGVAKCVGISQDGTMLAVGTQDAAVHLWEFGTGRKLTTLRGHDAAVSRVTFDPSGDRLASADARGRVLIWDWRRSCAIEEWAASGDILGEALALEFSQAEDVLAYARMTQPLIFLRSPSRGPSRLTNLHGFATTAIARPNGGNDLVVGTRDGDLERWNPRGTHRRGGWKGHQGGVTSLAYTPDGRSFLSAGQDGLIRLWSSTEDCRSTPTSIDIDSD